MKTLALLFCALLPLSVGCIVVRGAAEEARLEKQLTETWLREYNRGVMAGLSAEQASDAACRALPAVEIKTSANPLARCK
jgi:hypothetical protein